MAEEVFTPRSLAMLQLYPEVRDDHGDPVIMARMAMDRHTAETMYAAANSDCAHAHRELAAILGDIALGVLQLCLQHEIGTLLT